MRRPHSLAVRLLPTLALLAAPWSPGEARAETEVTGTASYSAPGALGTISDMKAFADEYFKSRFDLAKAAKVDKLVIQRDVMKFTLDGWVFRRDPVRGISSAAQFFGDAHVELTPPIAMEKQQVRRFLGTDAVDLHLNHLEIQFTGAEDQRLFDGLSYTTEGATEAASKSDEAKEWIADTRREYEKGLTEEEERSRHYQEFYTTAGLYRRLMDPKREGAISTHGYVKPAAAGDARSTLVETSLDYDPGELEEFTFAGRFDHGNGKPWSLISRFHTSTQYAGGMEAKGTSPVIEKEEKDDFGVASDVMKIAFNPTGKPDTTIHSAMDVVVRKNDVKTLAFTITPSMKVTHAELDGKAVDFYQPALPGIAWLHSPLIILALPRTCSAGEHVQVAIDCEGDNLKDLDGSIFYSKTEDTWLPGPASGWEAMATSYDTTMVVPKGFTAIGNGHDATCDPADVAPGKECFRYVTNVPIHGATFNIGKNMHVDRGMALDNVTPIAVYSSANRPRYIVRKNDDTADTEKDTNDAARAETGQVILNTARLAHAVYSDWFGKCPYDTLKLTPHPKGLGRGFAGLVLLDYFAWMSSTDLASQYNNEPWARDSFITHEIAHQWWGGAAGIRGDHDQWFSEGFADYGATLCMEAIDQKTGSSWMYGRLKGFTDLLTVDDGYPSSLVPLALGNRGDSSENRRGYESYRQNFMYSKGAMVMDMLRTLARAVKNDRGVGDALFKKSMHDFFTLCEGKAPSNLDLETSISRTYGMKLDWFFNQWVYGTGLPKIDFSYDTVAAPDGKGYLLRGRMAQKDTAFVFPVAVYIHVKGEKKDAPTFFYTWAKKQDETFEVPIPFKPDKVTLNDDLGLLAIVHPVAWQAPAGVAGQ